MGDARTGYSQTVMDEASAERIGHLVCSQSFPEERAVGYVFVSITLQLHGKALALLELPSQRAPCVGLQLNDFLSFAFSLCF